MLLYIDIINISLIVIAIIVMALVIISVIVALYERHERKVRLQEVKKREEQFNLELDHAATRINHARNPREVLAIFREQSEAVQIVLDNRGDHYRLPAFSSSSELQRAIRKYRACEAKHAEKLRRTIIVRETLEYIDEVQSAKTWVEKLQTLARLLDQPELRLSHDRLVTKDEVANTLLKEYALVDCLESTASRDINGFLEAKDVLELVWRPRRYKDVAPLSSLQPYVAYPENWDDLVVRFLQDPAIEDFPLVHERGTTSRLVAENAAKAVSERDLVGVQIARAHADDKDAHRKMMGDVMLEQLNRLVVELHKEHGLFQTEAGGVEV